VTTYQPVAPLIRLVRHQVRENGSGLIILSSLKVARQLVQRLDRVRLEQILVVEMVEQNVEALFGIDNVLLVVCWRFRLHTLHLNFEDLVQWTGNIGDVSAVTGGCFRQ
jgi:hypothetical protein